MAGLSFFLKLGRREQRLLIAAYMLCIYYLDKVVFQEVSLAGLYVFPLLLTGLSLTVPSGLLVLFAALLAGASSDPNVDSPSHFILRYVIVAVVLGGSLWAGQSMKQYLEVVETETRELEQANKSLRQLTISTVEAFVEAVEAKDKHLVVHSRNVARYARGVAERMENNPEQAESIFWAGLLHDLGKIGVEESILNKPGTLTPRERAQVQQHVIIGAKIVERIDSLSNIVSSILFHHERFDGQGYPNRLKGEEIPLPARIIAVADAFDAMTSDRPYRQRLPVETALEELSRCSGSQFDPRVVETFLSYWEKSWKGLEQEVS